MEQLLQGLHGPLRHPPVIVQLHLRPEIGQLPHRPQGGIAVQDPQPLRQAAVELFGQARPVGVLGHLKVQQLTVAGLAHRQRQHDGDDGMGMEALGVPDIQLRPGKGPLHRPQQVQIGDIGRRALLHKQQSQLRHRISLLPAGWRRRRCSGCGSPEW